MRSSYPMLLTVALLFGLASPAIAQDGGGGLTGGFGGLTPPDPPENASVAWQLRKRLLADADAELASKKLKELEELRVELGRQDMTEFAQALLAEAHDQTRSDGQGKPQGQGSRGVRAQRAVDLAQAAARLAPRLPDPHFLLARLHRLEGPDVKGILSQTIKGVRKTLKHPLRLAWLASELAMRGMVALLLMLLIFLLSQWIRYSGGLRHNLGDLLPNGMSPRQAGVVLAVLAMTPLLLGLPWAAVLGIWLVMPFAYQRTGERLISLLAVLVIATLPFTVRALDRVLHLRGGVGEALYSASYEFPSEKVRETLEQAVAADKADIWSQHGLALMEKRQGKLYKAEERLKAAIDAAGSQHAAAGPLLVNLGAVQIANNRLDEAEASYDKAIGRAPGLASAHFGLARVRQARGGDEEAVTGGIKDALALDEPLIEDFQAFQSAGLNRFVIDETVPPRVVIARLVRDPAPATLGPAILPLLTGDWPEEQLPLAGGGVLILMLAMWALRSRVRLASRCLRCGGPVCARCHPLVGRTEHCNDCYLAYHRSERITPIERQQQEMAVRRHRRRERSLSLILTLVATGAGHMLSGRALRGAALLFVFFGFLGLFVAWQGILRLAAPAFPGVPVAGMAAAVVLYLVIYVLAILDIRVEERS